MEDALTQVDSTRDTVNLANERYLQALNEAIVETMNDIERAFSGEHRNCRLVEFYNDRLYTLNTMRELVGRTVLLIGDLCSFDEWKLKGVGRLENNEEGDVKTW